MHYVELQRSIAEVEVNIAPLSHTAFNICKSDLKFFEAAAVGTWTVASHTPSLDDAIDDGVTGRLAKAHEWDDALREAVALARDPQAYADRVTPAAEKAHSPVGVGLGGRAPRPGPSSPTLRDPLTIRRRTAGLRRDLAHPAEVGHRQLAGQVGVLGRRPPPRDDGEALPLRHLRHPGLRLVVEQLAVGDEERAQPGAADLVAEVHVVEVARQRLGEAADLDEGRRGASRRRRPSRRSPRGSRGARRTDRPRHACGTGTGGGSRR